MLIGRDTERASVEALLEAARASRSGALIVRGGPGVGKTSLLQDAREAAGDMHVLGARGVESESDLAFAGLHQLLRPALHLVDALPGPQAEALRGAFGLGERSGADRFLIAVASLTLLSELAEQRPVLCLVDDVQWLDTPSADSLLFVSRRLDAEGVVILFGLREGEARTFDAPDLPELRLGGLDPSAAAALIDDRAGNTLSAEIRDRLVVETGGNPLALLELSSTLSEAQLSGAESVHGPIPVSTRIERAFLARADALPDETQTFLLVAAADDSGDLATVLRAAMQLGVSAEALDRAEQAGLVRVRGTGLELHHPLVRSAVYQAAPFSKRQAVHRALAGVLDGEAGADRRAWHRAAATVEPDAEVGEELEQAAQRARGRSGFAAASLAFERAASLSIDDGDRARRLSAAAESAWLAGRAERALTLLELLRPLVSEPIQRADFDRFLGLIEMTRGIPADACALFLRAAPAVAQVDDEKALELLNLAGLAAAYAGDKRAAVAIADIARGLRVAENRSQLMLAELLIGLGAHAAGNFADAAARLRVALELANELDDDPDGGQPVALLFAGRAAMYLGDDRATFRTHHEAAARARASGALSIVTQILARLATAEVWAGRWMSAAANAREGLELAREIGQDDVVAQQLVMLGLVAAMQGSEDECRSLAAESTELASARGLGIVTEIAQWSLAVLELGLGRPEEAYRRCREISATMVVFWGGLDRIEAAVRAGERETARSWLDEFERWTESSAADWARAVALHARALLSEDEDEADRLFSAALAAHTVAARPFERARCELAYGEFTRRARRRLEAREHLRTALDGFEALGATLWAERARSELRASGETARKRDPSTVDQLTPQELQIARLVAEGLSNKEVAAQLFLSPRTVHHHLRHIFVKLDITSRTQLARFALGEGGQAAATTSAAARA